jgi:hypothetical protein
VVRVDGDVQPHQLDKLLIVAVTEQSSQVGRVILVCVNGGHLSITVDVPEDSSSNVGELGNEVHGIIEGGLPVLLLGDTIRVGLGEGRVVVELHVSESFIGFRSPDGDTLGLTAVTAREN